MSGHLVLAPLLPAWLLAAVLIAAALSLAVVAWRRGRGWPWRALAFALLATALLDPKLVMEERQPRPDLALVVIDESPSQQIGQRPVRTEQARDALEKALTPLEGVEIRILRAGSGNPAETHLFQAIERSIVEDARERLGAVFVVTDGQVHDVPAKIPDWLQAPVHVLLTGERDERDRRVVIGETPAYGLVGSTATVHFTIEDVPATAPPAGSNRAEIRFLVDGAPAGEALVEIGRPQSFALQLQHGGPTILEIEAAPAPGEVSTVNNRTAVAVNGVRERLRVLLISGQPHPGERTWRNLLKSDPSVDLVHFTILRPPEKDDATPLQEVSLIVFPVQELFEQKLYDFDLIVFDRYAARGLLPLPYYQRIADYVRKGGAVLLAVGPEFADSTSLYHTALANILPATSTGRVIEKAFRPRVTDSGQRHPVTAGLPGAAGSATPTGEAEGREGAAWGQWFRLNDAIVSGGQVLMRGADDLPLLVVDRVGDGRVAQLLSDQIWLWARGYDGGGPHGELLRRTVHWLMKEPELEEERLAATVGDGRLLIERRSLDPAPREVTVTAPSGATEVLRLESDATGVARGELPAIEAGLWRVEDGRSTALAASGRINPPETADMRTTADRLGDLVKATGGGIAWLAEGIPAVRRASEGRARAGSGWLGVVRQQSYVAAGSREVDVLPGLAWLALILAALGMGWWREGR